MTFDGETISLKPSVGNWHRACRSHYVVDRGRVIEAGPWSDEEIVAERRRDRAAKAAHYRQAPGSIADHSSHKKGPVATRTRTGVRGWLTRLLDHVSGRRR